jgi:hypothetical protein
VSAPSSIPSSGSCPPIVPSCLNTWLSDVPHCKDNTDHTCWCPSEQFITDVYGCLVSWEPDLSVVQSAVYWLAGLCQDFVGSNPAIVTGCPPGVTIAPPPTAAVTPAASQIITTEVILQTVTSCPAGQTVAVGGVTTVVQTPTILTIDITSTTTVCPVCTQTFSSAPVQNLQTITVGGTTCTVPNVSFVTTTVAGQQAVSLVQPTVTIVPSGSGSAAPPPVAAATTPPTTPVTTPVAAVTQGSNATATYQPLQATTNAAVKLGSFAPAVLGAGLLALVM